MMHFVGRGWPGRLALLLLLTASPARAETVVAEPLAPVEVETPRDAPPIEVQVVLQLVVDAAGNVESAVETSRAPGTAPDSFAEAALTAVKAARFTPSMRDGRAIRSRIEHVVVFHAPQAPAAAPRASAPKASPPPVSSNEQDEDYAAIVEVHGVGWSSPRGIGDIRVRRELLDAAPHAQTSEMLSAAPGFFVDHEDGEGLGNDVYLRGFDLEHGAGIEMRVGSVPINIPVHIQGQGYADANFIIPEVVRSIRVLEGTYDPRQGDAAIAGSAYFDLGVLERGYQVKTSYGSFNQTRVLGIAAPKDASEETFAAFALRHTDGFGTNREARSGSVMAQYGLDLGAHDHLRLLATAYGARSAIPGVVRKDDVDAGRIGFDGAYPYLSGNQGIQSSRVIVGADFDHLEPSGAHFEFAPWVMWTDFRARQNFAGALETSRVDPSLSGIGDLFESRNDETAMGVTSRFHTAPLSVGPAEISVEPGVTVRSGHTDQGRSLLDPATLATWDRRIDVGLHTLDAGAYVDLDMRLWKRLRLSGGLRADLLALSIDDRLGSTASTSPSVSPGVRRGAEGVAVGPRVTAEYALTPSISPVFSYGEGFRSLDAAHLPEGASHPYSRVRSMEAGFRMQAARGRYATTLVAFETRVGNELVFAAASGGLETERASTRRGVLGSFMASPVDWLLASTALSVTSATFETNVPGIAHYVPNVPPIVFRADVTTRGAVGHVRGETLNGRIGAGYTFLSGRLLTDFVRGPSNNVLNASAALRYQWVELGVDAYNVLGLRYADDAEVYVSNWSVRPGQTRASSATHYTAAPPRTVLGTVALYF